MDHQGEIIFIIVSALVGGLLQVVIAGQVFRLLENPGYRHRTRLSLTAGFLGAILFAAIAGMSVWL